MIYPYIDYPVRYVDVFEGKPLSEQDQTYLDKQKKARKVISYGLSSYGYDVRISENKEQYRIFNNRKDIEINPKCVEEENFYRPKFHLDEFGGEYVHIPGHSYLQAPTLEYFKIPRDILVTVVGKSTYARSGLIVNVTPIEPEFEGEVVIEIANVTDSPVRCYVGEGIAQFIFMEGDETCRRSYKDKNGKYQGQRGITYAKV